MSIADSETEDPGMSLEHMGLWEAKGRLDAIALALKSPPEGEALKGWLAQMAVFAEAGATGARIYLEVAAKKRVAAAG